MGAWTKRSSILLVAVLLALGGGYVAWQKLADGGLPEGIASGNGRIEAVEIDVSTKAPGRISEILVNEGDFIEAGQVLARMDTTQLKAQRRQAEAQFQRALIGIDTAKSLVVQREAERAAALAIIAQRQAQLDAATSKLERSEQLAQRGNVSRQVLDDDRAAAISAAKAQVIDAGASVDAARAAIESISADIDDSTLVSPRDGRVQYRVAQTGEVLSAGGRILNLVDLSDVYMTFFLPTGEAGRIAIGTEVRLVLDAAPQYVIPARVTFVADVAQFTPKTVETAEERQKLMFRIKAHIDKELLQKHIRQVKTGLPGMAYVRVDPQVAWPAELDRNLVQ